MNEQDVRELAVYAGFTKEESKCDCSICRKMPELWYPPNKSTGSNRISLPDFPNDLNACLKYIEPKLFELGYRYQLTRLQDGHTMTLIQQDKDGWAEIFTEVLAESPSKAFCEAVSRLVTKLSRQEDSKDDSL